MSKYTTEVKDICEYEAELDGIKSQGFVNIEQVLDKSWVKIFTNNWEIFEEAHREVLCKKILRHYYRYEIGFESVGTWKEYLDEKMQLIMPYYNQLYEIETYEYEPLWDTNYWTDIDFDATKNNDNTINEDNTVNEDNTINEDNTTTAKTTDEENKTTTDNATEWKLYSDTPQGGVTGFGSDSSNDYMQYLTNATKTTKSETNEWEREEEINAEKVEDLNRVEDLNKVEDLNRIEDLNEVKAEDTAKHEYGKKNSSKSYAEMIQELRDIVINIDEMIVNDLYDLFMLVY